MTRFGIVCGLKAESDIIERATTRAGHAAPSVVCAGPDGARAQVLATSLIEQGAEAIVSFGLCGGLDPTLRPGTVLVAETVLAGTGDAIPTDTAARA